MAAEVQITVPARRLPNAAESRLPERDEGLRRRIELTQPLVLPGDEIAVEAGVLRGHGTYAEGPQRLRGAVCGVVERVNKLVCVRPLRCRYQAEMGDVVVGRVVEVGQGRWKVDVNGRTEATLSLNSVNLPGGVQRKRTYTDELNMRKFFCEGELICAEVQQLHSDGTCALHTRSARYGKLLQGTFVTVPASLIKRCKTHFLILPELGICAVFGSNGCVWVCPQSVDELQQRTRVEDLADTSDECSFADPVLPPVDPALRQRIARFCSCVSLLASAGVPIHASSVISAYEEAVKVGATPAQLLTLDACRDIIAAAQQPD